MTLAELHAAFDNLQDRVKALEAELQGAKGKRGRNATRIPDDFQLTPERISVATREGITDHVAQVFLHFTLYWRARGGKEARKLDWDATWRVWCMNTRKTAPANKPKGGTYDAWAEKHARNEDLGFG